MLLALDVGNTHTVVGLFGQGRALQKTWRMSTHPLCTGDEFRAKIAAFFALEGLEFDATLPVVVSSVVPPFTGMLRSVFGPGRLHVIDPGWPFSFSIQANPASQVGADRLVNAEAVLREYGAPAIIVDSGTATTICALSRGKAYLGGAIMPGIELSIGALAKNTAKLFAVELIAPAHAIGTNTSEAIRSGILFGYAAMIDGMVRRFKQELNEPEAPVIATGGVSALLKGLTTELTDFDPHLTLKGIVHLYETIRSR